MFLSITSGLSLESTQPPIRLVSGVPYLWGVKRPVLEADRFPLTVVKDVGATTSTLHECSWHNA
jgi:hypothetical protein